MEAKNKFKYVTIANATSTSYYNPRKHQNQIKTVNKLLDSLPNKEATILRLKYGLNGYKASNINAIASHPDVNMSVYLTQKTLNNAINRLKESNLISPEIIKYLI